VEAGGFLPDRVLTSTFERTRGRHQARPPIWRLPSMSRLPAVTAVGAAAVVVVLAVALVVPGSGSLGGPAPTPSTTPAPTTSASPSASSAVEASPPVDVSDWETRTSAQYGFTYGLPTGWTVTPATRAWDETLDVPLDVLSTGMESVETSTGGGIRFSAWQVPLDAGETVDTTEDLIAFAERYCALIGDSPCEGIADRAVPLCMERRDCHAALLVPFDDDVLAFFRIVEGESDPVTIAAIWRPERDLSVTRFGGARRLLEGFLQTMDVWPPNDGQVPGA
jgi:hypothetical protein